MELIIVIFFFALTSAVCLQVFVKAHDTARYTRGLNLSVLWADNVSEIFYEYGADSDTIKKTVADAFDLEDYSYSLDFSSDASFDYLTFTFTDSLKSEDIYTVTFKQHIQEVAHE